MTIKIVAFLLAAIGTFCLGQFCFRYVYNYRILKGSIQIVFLGFISFRSIKISNINNLKIMTRKDWSLNPYVAELWGNRLIGDKVLIEKKKYLLSKYIVITPNDAVAFIDAVKEGKEFRS